MASYLVFHAMILVLLEKNQKMEGKFGGLYKYACKVLNFFEPEFFVAENVTALGKNLNLIHLNNYLLMRYLIKKSYKIKIIKILKK